VRSSWVYVKNGQVEVLLGQKVYDGATSRPPAGDKIVNKKSPSEPIVRAELVRL